jgi:prepilin-type N-terminal cleavage/methylation domain-containing protein
MRKMLKNKKGFTLIELILVIAIIGILSAIALPKLSTFQDKAKAAKDEANIKLLNNLSQIYYADNGDYYDVGSAETSFTQFVNKLEDEDYITSDEETNLTTNTNWTNDSLPTYSEGTGIVTDSHIAP